jgi:hypothetical protein
MYFTFDRQFKILNVGDSFAELLKVYHDGSMDFEFTYSVSQRAVVQKNALTVNVSVIQQSLQPKPLMGNSHEGYVNTVELVGNILTQVRDAKLLLKQQEAFVVAKKTSDITTQINNENVGQLRAKAPLSNIPSLTTTELVSKPAVLLNQNNDVQPLLQFVAHPDLQPETIDDQTQTALDLNPQIAMYDMITRQGLDPSYVVELTHRSVPAINSLEGLLRSSRSPEQSYDPAVRLLNYYILANDAKPVRMSTADVTDDTMINVAESVTSDIVNVPVKIHIPAFALILAKQNIANFMIKFDLIDGSTQATVDSVTKVLDVARHRSLYFVPIKPPIVKVGSSVISSKINLEVKQRDVGANQFRVYKKTLSPSSLIAEKYVLVGNYLLSPMQPSLTVHVDKPIDSTVIYRCIPVGAQGNLGFEFTNVVVKPDRYTPNKATAINALSTDSGMIVEVRQFPPEAVSIEVLARNLTTHERDYRNVGGINLIDNATRVANYISVIDNQVTEHCVFEYVARITYRSGLTKLSNNTIVEFISIVPGKVDLSITDLNVINNPTAPNVTFTVQSTVLDQDLDQVVALLQRQDIQQFFQNDIAKEREFLNSLVAHGIQRVNLTTGQREDFGVITTSAFDDNALRKNNAVSPLQYGYKYRYEAVTLLRSPETMFQSFVKTQVDSSTNKTYKYSPAKFLHPITLIEGVIVSSTGLATRYTKDPMSHGQIGTIETIEVSFDDQPAHIINSTASRFNRDLNVITWKIEGAIDQVDHFLIIKDVHGVRTMIGKAHSEFPMGNCQYLHPLTSKDAGELTYIIVPIFIDYRIGIQVMTNSVIV